MRPLRVSLPPRDGRGRPRRSSALSGDRRTFAHRIRRQRRQTTTLEPANHVFCRNRRGRIHRTDQLAWHFGGFAGPYMIGSTNGTSGDFIADSTSSAVRW